MSLSPDLVHQRLRQAIRQYRWAQGSRLAIFGLAISLGLFLFFVVLDFWFHFGAAGRWIGFFLIVTPGLTGVSLGWWVWRRPVSEEAMARRIETTLPEARNVLINAVQFDRELPRNSALRSALFDEMSDPFGVVRWPEVFEWKKLQKVSVALGVVLVAIMGWAAFNPLNFANSAARLILPGSAIDPLTKTRIVSLTTPEGSVVRGNPFRVNAVLGGEIPEAAWVYHRERGNRWERELMQADASGNEFGYRWAEVNEPMEFYIRAGDIRSAVYPIDVRPPTALRQRVARVQPPAYTQLPEYQVADFSTLRELIPGSKVTFDLEFNYPVEKLDATAQGTSEPASVEPGDDPHQWIVEAEVRGDGQIQLAFEDRDGTQAGENLAFRVEPVEPPVVEIERPVEGSEVVAPADATLDVRFTARNRFGLGRIGLYESTDEKLDARLVAEWEPDNGAPTFSEQAGIALAEIAASGGDGARFVVVALDRNDITGPGRTVSRPIVVRFEDVERIRDQRADAESALSATIERLIEIQTRNLEETRRALGMQGGPESLRSSLLNRQIEVSELGDKLLRESSNLAPGLRPVLRELAGNEMPSAVLQLRNAAGSDQAERATGYLVEAGRLEGLILARLKGLPQNLKREQEILQVQQILGGLEELLKNQQTLHGETSEATGDQAPGLATRQDRLADRSLGVAENLRRESGAASTGNESLREQLAQIVAKFSEFQIYEEMLQAAGELENARPPGALQWQENVIKNLSQLVGMLNQWQVANARSQMEEMLDAVRDLNERLAKLEEIQKSVVEKSEELSRRGEFDSDDRAAMNDLRETKELMAEVLEQMMTDAHVLPEFELANEMLSELVAIYEDVIQADLEEVRNQELELEVGVSEIEEHLLTALEEAQEIGEQMETWLANETEPMQALVESFDETVLPDIPILPLNDDFVDLIGDLLEQQEDLMDLMQDAASNQPVDPEMAIGNEVADGPMPSFEARGMTGNEAPQDLEGSGRGTGGREGKSSGEMAGDTYAHLEGSETDARRTDDAIQPGHLEVTGDQQEEVEATGGGRAGGTSDRVGMEGDGVARARERTGEVTTDALAVTQALLAEQTAEARAEAKLLYLNTEGLDEVVRLMDASHEAIKAGRLDQFTSLHERIVGHLQDARGRIGSGEVIAFSTPEATSSTQEFLRENEGEVPDEYRDMVAEYYRLLSE